MREEIPIIRVREKRGGGDKGYLIEPVDHSIFNRLFVGTHRHPREDKGIDAGFNIYVFNLDGLSMESFILYLPDILDIQDIQESTGGEKRNARKRMLEKRALEGKATKVVWNLSEVLYNSPKNRDPQKRVKIIDETETPSRTIIRDREGQYQMRLLEYKEQKI